MVIIADETCQLAAIAEARIITRHSQRERLIGRSPAQLPANIVVSSDVGRRSIEPHETPISVPLVIGAGKTDSEFIPHERNVQNSLITPIVIVPHARLNRAFKITGRRVCCQTDSAAYGITPEKRALRRSEEHTSELQSLMRISYAVF